MNGLNGFPAFGFNTSFAPPMSFMPRSPLQKLLGQGFGGSSSLAAALSASAGRGIGSIWGGSGPSAGPPGMLGASGKSPGGVPAPSAPVVVNPLAEGFVGMPSMPTWAGIGQGWGAIPAPVLDFPLMGRMASGFPAIKDANPFFSAYFTGGATTYLLNQSNLFMGQGAG